MRRFRSLLSTRTLQQALPWLAGAALTLGVIAYLQVLKEPQERMPEAASRGPVGEMRKQATAPPSAGARRVIGEFINTAVLRRNLARAWKISGPNVRGELTRDEWMTGNIPVEPYDFDRKAQLPVRLDWSYPNEVLFAVTLHPRPGSGEPKKQLFFILAKKIGSGANTRWVVDYWARDAPPPAYGDGYGP